MNGASSCSFTRSWSVPVSSCICDAFVRCLEVCLLFFSHPKMNDYPSSTQSRKWKKTHCKGKTPLGGTISNFHNYRRSRVPFHVLNMFFSMFWGRRSLGYLGYLVSCVMQPQLKSSQKVFEDVKLPVASLGSMYWDLAKYSKIHTVFFSESQVKHKELSHFLDVMDVSSCFCNVSKTTGENDRHTYTHTHIHALEDIDVSTENWRKNPLRKDISI